MALPQRQLFVIGPDQLGSSSAIFSWNPRNNLLAVSGDKVSNVSCFVQPSAGILVKTCFRNLLFCSGKCMSLTKGASLTTISPYPLLSSLAMRSYRAPGIYR